METVVWTADGTWKVRGGNGGTGWNFLGTCIGKLHGSVALQDGLAVCVDGDGLEGQMVCVVAHGDETVGGCNVIASGILGCDFDGDGLLICCGFATGGDLNRAGGSCGAADHIGDFRHGLDKGGLLSGQMRRPEGDEIGGYGAVARPECWRVECGCPSLAVYRPVTAVAPGMLPIFPAERDSAWGSTQYSSALPLGLL